MKRNIPVLNSLLEVLVSVKYLQTKNNVQNICIENPLCRWEGWMTSSPCDGELWIVFSHYKTTPARVVIYGILYSNFRKYFPMAECRLMIWHHDALRGSEVRWNLREGFKMISIKDYIYSSAVPTLLLLSHRRI